MAALAQLAEQVASSKNGSAEPHLLRPLPFLIYLADGDTVRGPLPPPVPPSPLPRRPLAAPSAACRGPAPALPHSLPCPPAEAGARQLQRLPERRGAQARDESLQATPRGRLLPSAGGLQGGGRKQRRARPLYTSPHPNPTPTPPERLGSEVASAYPRALRHGSELPLDLWAEAEAGAEV